MHLMKYAADIIKAVADIIKTLLLMNSAPASKLWCIYIYYKNETNDEYERSHKNTSISMVSCDKWHDTDEFTSLNRALFVRNQFLEI